MLLIISRKTELALCPTVWGLLPEEQLSWTSQDKNLTKVGYRRTGDEDRKFR